MCRKTCCISVLSSERAGEHVPSLGRKIGCVHRLGHVKSYRFAWRNPSARAVFKRARPRYAVSSAQSRSRTSVLALHQPSLGRRNGLVRPIGRVQISRFWSKNCRARPDSGRARTTTAAVEKPVQGTLFRPRPAPTRPPAFPPARPNSGPAHPALPRWPLPAPPRSADSERGPPQPVLDRLPESCPAPPCPARTSPAQPPGPCRSVLSSRAPAAPGSGRGARESPRRAGLGAGHRPRRGAPRRSAGGAAPPRSAPPRLVPPRSGRRPAPPAQLRVGPALQPRPAAPPHLALLRLASPSRLAPPRSAPEWQRVRSGRRRHSKGRARREALERVRTGLRVRAARPAGAAHPRRGRCPAPSLDSTHRPARHIAEGGGLAAHGAPAADSHIAEGGRCAAPGAHAAAGHIAEGGDRGKWHQLAARGRGERVARCSGPTRNAASRRARRGLPTWAKTYQSKSPVCA
jgi:hypothetical protein